MYGFVWDFFVYDAKINNDDNNTSFSFGTVHSASGGT